MTDRASATEPPIVIALHGVTKYRSKDFDRARRFAFRDLWWRRSAAARPGEIALIDDISLEVRRGETLGVIGPPGSGKATLCRLLVGATRPSAGRIERNGRVRLVPAGPFGTTPHMKLREYARFLLAVFETPPDEVDERSSSALRECGIADSAHSKLQNLSRVELNRLTQHLALRSDADAFIFDRAPKLKDPAYQADFERQLEAIFESRTAIVATTDPRRLPNVDRCLVLSAGAVVYVGELDEAVRHFDNVSAQQDSGATGRLNEQGQSDSLEDFDDDDADLEWTDDDSDGDHEPIAASFAPAAHMIKSCESAGAPVVIGPYLGHSGYEGTYWVPLIRGLQRRTGLEPRNTFAVVRSRSSLWYEGTAQPIALDELFPEDDVAQLLAEYQKEYGLKQSRVSPFERSIVDRVRARAGLADARWIETPLLSHGIYAARGEQWKLAAVRSELSFPDLSRTRPTTDRPILAWFDQFSWFPDQPLYSLFVRRTLELLAELDDVRMVATGVFQEDGIHEFDINTADLTLTPVAEAATARDRLARIDEELSSAAVHVGVLGGGSALAVARGVPSVQLVSGFHHSAALQTERTLIEAYAQEHGRDLIILDVVDVTPEAVVLAVIELADRNRTPGTK